MHARLRNYGLKEEAHRMIKWLLISSYFSLHVIKRLFND